MRRQIYITILKMLFIAIVASLVIDQLFVQIVIPNQYDFSNVKKIKKLIEQERPEEIPILGSSIAKRSYYPDSIGQGYYNYGMAGSVFVMLEPLIKIELEKEKTNPIIIDFEHHFFLSHDEIRIQLSNYIPHVDNSHIRKMLEERGLLNYQYDIPGLRLFGQYDEYLLDLLRLRFNREYSNRGGLFFKYKKKDFRLYRERRQRMIDEMKTLRKLRIERPKMLNSEKEYKLELLDILLNSRPDPKYVARFEKLLTDNRKRDFILVYSPQHSIKLMGLENHGEVVALLSKLDADHDNLFVLDYSLAGFSDDHYHDSGHMNIKGAHRFSSMLRRDIERIFPERSDL
ncbi:MAG: hypothetical protein HKO93_04310, partial [Flavobacteriales bacterium]|nr:hypothetical protein [Flavobacteriales bacterium]